MIITIRFDGVLAEYKDPVTASRHIPQGLSLVEAFSEEFPVYVLVNHDMPADLVRQWMRQHMRWTAVPWIFAMRSDETVAESVLRAMGNQSTVLFHVDADPAVIEEVRSAGIATFQFGEAHLSYPPRSQRKAFEDLL